MEYLLDFKIFLNNAKYLETKRDLSQVVFSYLWAWDNITWWWTKMLEEIDKQKKEQNEIKNFIISGSFNVQSV